MMIKAALLFLCLIGPLVIANERIVLRVRTPSGSLKRMEFQPSTTVADIRQQLEAAGCLSSPADELMKDQSIILEDERQKLGDMGLKNGEVISIRSKGGNSPNQTSSTKLASASLPKPKEAEPSSTKDASAPRPSSSSSSFQERMKKKREVSSSSTSPVNVFMPFPELARKRNVEQARNQKGFSWHDIEVEEGSKFNVKQQEKPNIGKVSMGLQCAESFSNFLTSTNFENMRCGLLLGRWVNSTQQVRVEAIYEPPQHPRATAVEYDPQDLNFEAAGCKEALKVAKWLGMDPVGWIFSCPPRDYELSALDVFTGARLELEAMKTMGREQGKKFALVAAKTSSEGSVEFEAFQISNLAVQMHAEGVLLDNDNIAQMADKIRTTENVVAESRNTREIDCLWFTIPVPIVSHISKLSATFPPANRGGHAVRKKDLQKAIFGNQVEDDAPSALEDKLSDFHLLLQLQKKFEKTDDFQSLCSLLSVRKKKVRIPSKYHLLLEMICGKLED